MEKKLFGQEAEKLIAKYVATGGKDHSFKQRAQFWVTTLGDKPRLDITPEDIEHGLSVYMAQGKCKVVRTGKGNERAIVLTGVPHSGGTINKIIMAFANWQRRSTASFQKTYVSPTKYVEKQKEGKGRFLDISKTEIETLVKVAGLSRWRPLAALIAVASSKNINSC